MNIVVFGLTISSSWGNGHATLWRGLCKALARGGHRVVFFEHDQPYYAEARDYESIPGGELVLYPSWKDVVGQARRALEDADAAIITSYCPDALEARNVVLDAPHAMSVFYDLDTPVTLARLRANEPVHYLDARGLRDFDLVLSYTGGSALDDLCVLLGAQRVHTLYGHADPDVHHPVAADERYRADLAWIGTYAEDRQNELEEFFLEPARRRPALSFGLAGAQYPAEFPWEPNIRFVRHLPPSQHSAFLCSSRWVLNVTRAQMARCGWCPSGRLFEAAACGVAIVSDDWPGLDTFYRPGEEIVLARSADDVLRALDAGEEELRRIARRARERTLDEHTSAHRAHELLALLDTGTAAARVDNIASAGVVAEGV